MNIYDKYPMMKPFIGESFGLSDRPALFLIGESHYLPKNSTIHLNPGKWYSGVADQLNQKEIKWISTSSIIKRSRETGFKRKSHSIWRKSFKVINNSGPAYLDYSEVAKDIAFSNFFLRPARQGDSLKPQQPDITIANETLLMNYQKLNPTALVFLSRLAFQNFQLQDSIDIPVIATPHPASNWWNRAAKKYGNRRGQDILRDFVKTLHW